MMANIAPRAADEDASEETLILFAVLSVYQDAGFPGAPSKGWQGVGKHARRAFDFAQGLGDEGVAAELLRTVAKRSQRERDPFYEELLGNSLGNNPARIAAHDREMASLVGREIRAAKLFDKTASLDKFILGESI